MSPFHLLRPEREPPETGALAFRRQLLVLLSISTFYGVGALTIWFVEPPGPTNMGALAVLIGMAGSALTFLLRKGWPRLSGWLYLAALLSVCALASQDLQTPVFWCLLLIAAIVGPVLVGVGGGVLVTGAAAASLLLLPSTGWEARALVVVIVGLAMACCVGIIATRMMRLIDFWERQVVVTQREMVVKLRSRQGELNRTLKALDEAFATLKRNHDELVLARREAEEARTREEQFVANVSHELRTPLNLIVGFTEVMYLSPEIYDGVHWTPELQGDIEEMYRASRHLQSLVDDILDLSRIDAARLPMFRELQDIRPILLNAVDTLAPLLRQRRLACNLELPETLPQLFVDETRIRQVMINLLNNAARFTERGTITVRTWSTDTSVEVSVCDTGVGIAPNQIGQIFETFRQVGSKQSRQGGAGLGLALSRQFVQLHGGSMRVASTLGQGSTFSFSLPLPGAVPSSTPLHRTADRRVASIETAPVIVVDPDPSTADMLARYLDDHIVLAASTGEEAESLLEAQHPLAIIVNQPPDLATEEWLGALGEASERYAVPVVRCSIPSPGWLRRSGGFDDCFSKPVSLDTLRSLLGRSPAALKVLVVDDDPAFVTLMTRMLSTIPTVSNVLPAYSGDQAIKLVHEKRPDLVFVDLVMPGMDGFEVAANLRRLASTAEMRIVGVTATSYAEEALSKKGSYLTVTRSRGLSTGNIVESLRAMLKIMRPDYLVGLDNTSSSA